MINLDRALEFLAGVGAELARPFCDPDAETSFSQPSPGQFLRLLGRDGRFPAVVAAEVENRQRFGSADNAGIRHAAARTHNPGGSFSHEIPLNVLLDSETPQKDSQIVELRFSRSC